MPAQSVSTSIVDEAMAGSFPAIVLGLFEVQAILDNRPAASPAADSMPPKSWKTGPPKHQNAFTWVPHSMDKHNALAKTMERLDLRGGVCDK